MSFHKPFKWLAIALAALILLPACSQSQETETRKDPVTEVSVDIETLDELKQVFKLLSSSSFETASELTDLSWGLDDNGQEALSDEVWDLRNDASDFWNNISYNYLQLVQLVHGVKWDVGRAGAEAQLQILATRVSSFLADEPEIFDEVDDMIERVRDTGFEVLPPLPESLEDSRLFRARVLELIDQLG